MRVSHECSVLLAIVAAVNMAASILQLILVTFALDSANHQLDSLKAQENSMRSLRVELEHDLHKIEAMIAGKNRSTGR